MFPVLQHHLNESDTGIIWPTLSFKFSIRFWEWRIKYLKEMRYTVDMKFSYHSVLVLCFRVNWIRMIQKKYYETRQERSNVLLQVTTCKLRREELYK